MVSLLDRKLFRDILAIRGQVATIALVVASGMAVFIASISTYESLQAARQRFYDSGRFPQIFVSLKRAPRSVAAQLAQIPGVATVESRIVRDVIVDWPASVLPVSARLISIARAGDEPLTRLYMRRGTAPEPGDTRSAVINEAFAEANGISPGMDLRIILNGRVEIFRITGIALSPEFVYAVKPGTPIPDDRFYAILWIDRTAAEPAFAMDGAFNDAVIALTPGANEREVIDEIDRILEPYGSVGAIARRDQPSNRFLEDELNQQKTTSITIPIIFFGIAAFLLNVALGRLVSAQREQIAALKALGFPNTPLVLHYLKLVGVIVLLGSMLGIAGGVAFGRAMIASYHGFFRFPQLAFELTPWSVVIGAVISFAAASLGVLTALQTIVSLKPAVAMQAAAPVRFRSTFVERLFGKHPLSPSQTMILRNILGRPWRTALTTLGIALAVPMVVLGLFWRDAINHMMDVQFTLIERGNTFVTFPHPLDRSIIRDLVHEPGVLAVEGQRIVPVRLRAGHRSYLTSIIGLPLNSELRQPRDAALRKIDVPPAGVVLTRRLGERLGVSPGDTLRVEVMEGRRHARDLPVAALVEEVVGMAVYMDLDALNRLTGEGDVVSAAELFVEPSSVASLSKRFKDLPVIESLAMKAQTITSFLDKIAGLVLVAAGILTGFAVIIAVGVVYNSARISLHERAWELAGLRVLGFTRAEVSRIIFAEFMIEIAVGIPLGLWLSQVIVDLIARFHSNESFQIPAVIGAQTFVLAAVAVLAAAAASAYVVRRRIDRLDLVAVLKTRD